MTHEKKIQQLFAALGIEEMPDEPLPQPRPDRTWQEMEDHELLVWAQLMDAKAPKGLIAELNKRQANLQNKNRRRKAG